MDILTFAHMSMGLKFVVNNTRHATVHQDDETSQCFRFHVYATKKSNFYPLVVHIVETHA